MKSWINVSVFNCCLHISGSLTPSSGLVCIVGLQILMMIHRYLLVPWELCSSGMVGHDGDGDFDVCLHASRWRLMMDRESRIGVPIGDTYTYRLTPGLRVLIEDRWRAVHNPSSVENPGCIVLSVGGSLGMRSEAFDSSWTRRS